MNQATTKPFIVFLLGCFVLVGCDPTNVTDDDASQGDVLLDVEARSDTDPGRDSDVSPRVDLANDTDETEVAKADGEGDVEVDGADPGDFGEDAPDDQADTLQPPDVVDIPEDGLELADASDATTGPEVCQVILRPAPRDQDLEFFCTDRNPGSETFGGIVSSEELSGLVWLAYFGSCT